MSIFSSKFQLLLTYGLLAVLCSCNSVKYIAINNNEIPRRVTVTFRPNAEISWESDTLNAGPSGETEFDTVLVRQNLDSATYTFIAPANKHIELMPKGKGDVITSVKIEAGAPGDTDLTIDLTDKEKLKQLGKTGVIQWYGQYSDLIIINKGNPADTTVTSGP